jgi:hypothetical protein
MSNVVFSQAYPDPASPQNPDGSRTFGYSYDPTLDRPSARQGQVGNRQMMTSGATGMTTTYTTNGLNQYTLLTSTARAPEAPAYDGDGNLTNDGQFAYTWDAENRLTSVGPVSRPVCRSRSCGTGLLTGLQEQDLWDRCPDRSSRAGSVGPVSPPVFSSRISGTGPPSCGTGLLAGLQGQDLWDRSPDRSLGARSWSSRTTT